MKNMIIIAVTLFLGCLLLGFCFAIIATICGFIKNHYVLVICIATCVASTLIGGYDLLQVALLGCLIVAMIRLYFRIKRKIIEMTSVKERKRIQKIMHEKSSSNKLKERGKNAIGKPRKLKEEFTRNKVIDDSDSLEDILNRRKAHQ